MTDKLRVLSVFGTRPEAIKMCPLVLKMRECEGLESLVCVTAQHREMLDSVLSRFGVVPDRDLDLMRPGQSLEGLTASILEAMGDALDDLRPDLVLVHGDTTTSFAAALAAFYKKIPVGHVEAGLRSGDRYSPFPEEMNRSLTARLATLHFAPTVRNARNLAREGVTEGVFVTGNTVIDALRYTVGDGSFETGALRDMDFEHCRVIALTCHRRENYGAPMENIFRAVRRLAADFPEVRFVYPVHPAPAVKDTAARLLADAPGVTLLPPLDAFEMHRLMAKSYLVMTDSGGLQEEAPALGRPVLVLRRETERPEAVEAGTVRLAGTEEEAVYAAAARLLTDEEEYARMARAVNPYGDGFAAARIVQAIEYMFGLRREPPEVFAP